MPVVVRQGARFGVFGAARSAAGQSSRATVSRVFAFMGFSTLGRMRHRRKDGPQAVFINGRPQDLGNRQQMLMERYRDLSRGDLPLAYRGGD